MTKNTEPSYQFEFRPDGLLVIQLGVHCENPPSQPRIRWRIEDTGISGDDATLRTPPNGSNFWLPYGTIEVREPRLVFGRAEDPRPALIPEPIFIDGEERETITLPDQLGHELRSQLEELGTVSSSEQICTDPSAFPSVIKDDLEDWEAVDRDPIVRDNQTHWESTEWEPIYWEPERKVMWYGFRQMNDPERSYQIENSRLVWREFDMKSVDTVTTQEIDRGNRTEAGN